MKTANNRERQIIQGLLSHINHLSKKLEDLSDQNVCYRAHQIRLEERVDAVIQASNDFELASLVQQLTQRDARILELELKLAEPSVVPAPIVSRPSFLQRGCAYAPQLTGVNSSKSRRRSLSKVALLRNEHPHPAVGPNPEPYRARRTEIYRDKQDPRLV